MHIHKKMGTYMPILYSNTQMNGLSLPNEFSEFICNKIYLHANTVQTACNIPQLINCKQLSEDINLDKLSKLSQKYTIW